jgi:hypothetical protein
MANSDTVDKFFSHFAKGGDQDLDAVLQLFSPDTPPKPKPPTSPTLGIASNAGPTGPQFPGHDNILKVFTQLVLSFPHLVFAPSVIDPLTNKAIYCSSSDSNTIMVEASLDTGKHTNPWFSKTDVDFYSKPLSDIEPDGNQKSTVPACAVFVFDPANQGKILRLGIYMDRWQMAVDLWPQPQSKKAPKSAVRPFPVPY